MLEPLDSERLRSLLFDGDKSEYLSIRAAKRFFAKSDVIEGVYDLLQAFRVIWRPYLYHGHKSRDRWHIHFADPPFDTIYLRGSGNSVEIFQYRQSFMTEKEIREALNHLKCTASIEMIGRPENWVVLLQWLWNYGNEVYTTNVMNGSMLRPLDYRKLDTLVEEDSDADCESIRRIKACFGKEKDLARGIVCLFEGWEVFAPRIHRDRETENNWHVTFRDSPFRSLRIQPNNDPGVVDVYAFDKHVNSFHILNNTKTSDRDMWQRLLIFVWDYGRRRRELKRQWEERLRLLHEDLARSQPKSKRPDKHLLHKVLRTAVFKAQRGAGPRANRKKAIQAKEDYIMEDIDTGVHAEESLSCQLSNHKSPLRATNPNAQLGTLWNAKGMVDSLTAKAADDDVDIGALAIMDCQP